MKIFKRFWWVFVLVPVLLAGGFVLWASSSLGPMPEAMPALASDEVVQVATTPWLVFEPLQVEASDGLILYPGGRVDPRAYAPAARAIAEAGYLVVITPMPLNLAVFSPGRAAAVMAVYPQITNWTVGGHSLGGAMAASFAQQNPMQVDGLVLWAAYPASNTDLSGQQIWVSSVSGTLDGLATPEKIEASRPLLPVGALWRPIEGGNHAQFGWYGEQEGDLPATISREEQQSLVVEATLELLSQVTEANQ